MAESQQSKQQDGVASARQTRGNPIDLPVDAPRNTPQDDDDGHVLGIPGEMDEEERLEMERRIDRAASEAYEAMGGAMSAAAAAAVAAGERQREASKSAEEAGEATPDPAAEQGAEAATTAPVAPPAAAGGSGATAAAGAAAGASAPAARVPAPSQRATSVIVIGLAGSGKTTLMQRLVADLHGAGRPPYVLNLDPAVTHVPYGAQIDIRDTVKYKQVMKQYGLGPNGAIMTSLNLFTTKFDEVLGIMGRRAAEHDHFLVDTPGQIEVFTWSASGNIITETLAATFPSVVLFVVDTPRTQRPTTFMSNMLSACSIMYKTRLPFVIVFNKVDRVDCSFAGEWMQDFEAFQDALDADKEEGYAKQLTRSLSLVLDEFYGTIRHVGVSALTGEGIPELLEAIQAARQEYVEGYWPELQRVTEARAALDKQRRAAAMARLRKDLGKAGAGDQEGEEQEGGAAGAAAGDAQEPTIGLAAAAQAGLQGFMPGGARSRAQELASGGPGRGVRADEADLAMEAERAARDRLMRQAPAVGVMANGRRRVAFAPSEGEVQAEVSRGIDQAAGEQA